MSDFDDFDDLDAVRDFRSAVGLMTPEVDERIRRRIIDLAIARGVADGARTDDDTMHADGPTEPTIVLDLPVEGNVPPVPTPSAGTGSSDGSAASVVELHPAARPPARQPRVLVAAAAIFVVVILAGAVFAARQRRESVDVASPITDVTTLVARIQDGAPATTLGPSEFLQTVDRVSKPEAQGGQEGTTSYLRTFTRGPSGARPATTADGLFSPNGSATSTSVQVAPPGILTDRPFDGLTYDEVRQLGTKTVEQIRTQMLGVERIPDGVETFDVVRNELDLLRIDVTPRPARARLVQVLVAGAYTTRSQTLTSAGFELVIGKGADDTVRITFDPDTGALRRWVHLSGGNPVEQLEPVSSRTVT